MIMVANNEISNSLTESKRKYLHIEFSVHFSTDTPVSVCSDSYFFLAHVDESVQKLMQ